MSSGNNDYYDDWFRRFFNRSNRFGYGGFSDSDFFDMNPFRDFEDIRSQMQKMFDQFDDSNSDTSSKELVKEYQTPDGSKVRQVGPIVYGYSMTIGPDGKPRIQEFGNVRPSERGFEINSRTRPRLSNETEPLVDIDTTGDQITVVLEIPGVKKEDIKINATEDSVEVKSTDPKRRYHKNMKLPNSIDIESVKTKFNNGILEITFNKKKEAISKAKEIKID
ncbi:archaeal heat shock protein Hsp20 [Candidatus Nitrosocosmicus sp. FF01]|uniref:archaeal heat shock protein Hsp20 n=1 Tax=Candidatus Nitrosocosmicus sp. FF01 TaxID=3397670 RepID=UPI0039EAF7C6